MRADLALFLCVPATIIAVEIVLFLRFRAVLASWTGVMQSSTKLLGDKNLSDDEKQERMAKAAGQTLIGTFKIFGIVLAALVGFIAFYSLAISLTRVDTSTLETLVRLDVQVGSILSAFVWLWVRARVFS